MKKVVLSVVLGVLVVLGVASLMHASTLSGYQDGCRDVVEQGAQEEGLQIPDQVVDSYCHDLVQKYAGKRDELLGKVAVTGQIGKYSQVLTKLNTA